MFLKLIFALLLAKNSYSSYATFQSNMLQLPFFVLFSYATA